MTIYLLKIKGEKTIRTWWTSGNSQFTETEKRALKVYEANKKKVKYFKRLVTSELSSHVHIYKWKTKPHYSGYWEQVV